MGVGGPRLAPPAGPRTRSRRRTDGRTDGRADGRTGPGAYEDDPTLPWWDARDNVPEPRWSPTRLLAVAGVIAVALLLCVLIGAFALT